MIETKEDLEYCLRRWGREFGEPPPVDDAEDDERVKAPAENPIAELREFAAPKKASERELRQHRAFYGRSVSRLLLLGKNAGLQRKDGAAPVPAWASDPVRAPRSSNGGKGYVVRDPIAEAVEHAALQLHRFDATMGVCLRVEYCVFGRFKEKVERAGFHLGVKLPAREYRRGVDRAKVWMWGKLS